MFDQVLGQELYMVTWPVCANNVQSGKELGHHQPVQELLAGHVRNVRSGHSRHNTNLKYHQFIKMLLHGGSSKITNKISNLRHGTTRSLAAVSGCPVSKLHSHVNRFAEYKLGKEAGN